MAKYFVYFLLFFIAIVFQCVHGAVFRCQNEEINIYCPYGAEINITNAFYGSNNNTICVKGNKTEPQGPPCSLANATFIVAEKCNKKERCTISVNSTIFGTSCPEKSTYLEVNYTCKPKIKCGKHEHIGYPKCDCGQFCPNTIRCFPTCIYEYPSRITCVCDNGYLRDTKTGRCVLAQYCPIIGNPNNTHEEFCECANRQKTCEQQKVILFPPCSCSPGYCCKDGYLRNTQTHACVLPKDCPSS